MKNFKTTVNFLLLFTIALCMANNEKLDIFDPLELPDFSIKQRPGWQGRLPWVKDLQKPTQSGGQDSYLMFNPAEDQSQSSDHVYPYEVEDMYDDEAGEKELDWSAPYGIQNVRDTKEVRRTKNNHRAKLTFQSLCQAQRKYVNLNHNDVFEYRPDHYEEVSCLSPFYADPSVGGAKDRSRNKVCGEAGFSCVQLNRTIFLTRRLRGTDCWESETRTVFAGCECMWPKHTFGDIAAHH